MLNSLTRFLYIKHRTININAPLVVFNVFCSGFSILHRIQQRMMIIQVSSFLFGNISPSLQVAHYHRISKEKRLKKPKIIKK